MLTLAARSLFGFTVLVSAEAQCGHCLDFHSLSRGFVLWNRYFVYPNYCFSWQQLHAEAVFGGVRALGCSGEALHLSGFHTAVKHTGSFEPGPGHPVWLHPAVPVGDEMPVISLEPSPSLNSDTANTLGFSAFSFLIKKTAKEKSVLCKTVDTAFLILTLWNSRTGMLLTVEMSLYELLI